MENSAKEEDRKMQNLEKLKTLTKQLEEKKKMIDELDKKLEDRNEIIKARKKELKEADQLLQVSRKKLEESSTEVIEMRRKILMWIEGASVVKVYSQTSLQQYCTYTTVSYSYISLVGADIIIIIIHIIQYL